MAGIFAKSGAKVLVIDVDALCRIRHKAVLYRKNSYSEVSILSRRNNDYSKKLRNN